MARAIASNRRELTRTASSNSPTVSIGLAGGWVGFPSSDTRQLRRSFGFSPPGRDAKSRHLPDPEYLILGASGFHADRTIDRCRGDTCVARCALGSEKGDTSVAPTSRPSRAYGTLDLRPLPRPARFLDRGHHL